MAGAHLDSVAAGPGVNDDGSGTSAQLEIAKQIARKGLVPEDPLRVVRRRGGGPDRVDLLRRAPVPGRGRQDHDDDRHRHDLLPQRRPPRYDGDGSEPGNPAGPPGSGEVERVFVDFWKSQGLSSEPIPFDGRSDYVGFTDRGIPAGGIFAGAEAIKDTRAGGDLRGCGG
jgi:Zn-dependent M28 family amino/carboxypeptidase